MHVKWWHGKQMALCFRAYVGIVALWTIAAASSHAEEPPATQPIATDAKGTARAGTPLEDHFFDSAGVRIRYVIGGNEAGEPVLLLHGLGATSVLNWKPTIDSLGPNFRVIALDHRGHGRSGKPHDPDAYGVHMVEDAIRLLDHLGIERAHVVGYSLGGFVAGKLLFLHPERCRTVVLGGAGYVDLDSKWAMLIEEVASSLESGGGVAPLMRRLEPVNQSASEEQIQTANRFVMLANDAKALAGVARGMKQFYVSKDQIQENKVPTLGLVGERDPLLEAAKDLEAIPMPNYQLIILPGATHQNAPFQREFLAHLQDFLLHHRETAAPSSPTSSGPKGP